MADVYDWSWGRVGGSNASHALAVKNDGAVGAIRYFCWPSDGAKRLSVQELAALHQVRLPVAPVWETYASRAGDGWSAGVEDALAADAQADALGFPADRPIYYAVDFQAYPSQVLPYFLGVASIARRPWGVYGHYDIIETMVQYTPWLWQCAAWSGVGSGSGGSIQGRRLSKHALLFQRVGYVLNGTCDANNVVALSNDWGGWHPDIAYDGKVSPSRPEGALMSDEVEALMTALDGVRQDVAALTALINKNDTDTRGYIGSSPVKIHDEDPQYLVTYVPGQGWSKIHVPGHAGAKPVLEAVGILQTNPSGINEKMELLDYVDLTDPAAIEWLRSLPTV